MISAVFLYGVGEKSKCSERISVIDNILWTKNASDRQTEGGLSCTQRVGSKIMGGWRLANGPPRASNIRRYIADISKYNSKQGQQMTNSNIHSPIYLCKKRIYEIGHTI